MKSCNAMKSCNKFIKILLLNTIFICAFIIFLNAKITLADSPVPEIKVNGADNPIEVSSLEDVTVSVGLNPYDKQGMNVDWWIAAFTQEGLYYLELNTQMEFQWNNEIKRLIECPMSDFPQIEIPTPPLSQGKNYIFFALDNNSDGKLDATWYDFVEVNVADANTGLMKSSIPYNDSPVYDEADRNSLVNSFSDFTIDFYHEVIENDEAQDKNIFFSTYSIENALAMIWAGANNDTSVQIADTLHLTLPPEKFHSTLNALNIDLNQCDDQASSSGEPFQLNLINAVWSRIGYPFLSSYLDTIAEHYNAGVTTLDFINNPDGSRKIINQWIEDQTSEKVKNLLPENSITSDTEMVITNTIYFKASWLFPFDEELTHPGDFTRLDDSIIISQMMHQMINTQFFTGDSYDAVELPYVTLTDEEGCLKELSMLLIIPHEDNFKTVENTLDYKSISSIVSSLTTGWINLTLPKFEFNYEIKCKEIMYNIGMVDMFNPLTADFTKMVNIDDSKPWIDQIYHKAFIAVDEKGTEASAATAGVGIQSIVPSISADKPFIFFIRDNITGTILFVGRVLDPV